MFKRLAAPITIVIVVVLAVTLSTNQSGLAIASPPIAGRQNSVALLGTAITYQGKLNDGDVPANGTFDFVYALYDSASSGTMIAEVVINDYSVQEGLFAVTLDFGDVFDGTPIWLQIAVRPGNSNVPHTILEPRTAFLGTPYAHYSTRAGSVPWSGLSGIPSGFSDNVDNDLLSTLSCANGQIAEWNGSAWICGSDDTGGGTAAWQLTGNGGTSPGNNFLGTTDNQALQLRVNNARAFLIEPDATSPNLLGGYWGNMVGTDVSGAVIAGGGYDLALNVVEADFGVIGGGVLNTVSGYAGVVSGGQNNTASGAYSFAGGASNEASGNYSGVGAGENNQAGGTHSVVDGGYGNTASGAYSTIGGGMLITVTANHAAAAGGLNIFIGGTASAIGGGEGNTIFTDYAVIGGGRANLVTATYGTIAGGGPVEPANPTTTNNRVLDDHGTVGGGGGNVAGSDDGDTASAPFSTIAGGANNQAAAAHAFIGGGEYNLVTGYDALVSGGATNTAGGNYAAIGGGSSNATAANYSTIAGGSSNSALGVYAAIGGGSLNSVDAGLGFIGGGVNNTITATYGTIAGGSANISSASYASIGGGTENIAGGYAAFIGGGEGNACSAEYTTIGGGVNNLSNSGYSTIGGGEDNLTQGPHSTVSGGYNNSTQNAFSTVGGGSSNRAWGEYSVVPGGRGNSALGNNSFAAGEYAQANHDGSFIWSDSQQIDVTSGSDQFLIFANGGVGIGTNGGGFGWDDTLLDHALTVEGSTYLQFQKLKLLSVLNTYTQTLNAPSSVFATGNEVYVTSYSTNTLTIIDVMVPTNPKVIGVTTSNLSGPVDVQVAGQRAYVASELNRRLVVFDVSDPSVIDSMGSIWTVDAIKAIYVTGKYAYAALSDGVAVYDISDPQEIVFLSKTPGFVNGPSDIFVAGNFAYVTSQDDNRLVVFDISNPHDIAYRAEINTFLLAPSAVQVRGNHAFVLSRNNDILVIYDISDPDSIFTVGTITMQTGCENPISLHVSGDYAYIACEGDGLVSSGLDLFDISDPANIRRIISGGASGTSFAAIAVNGANLYIADSADDTLQIYEVTHLKAPVLAAGDLRTDHLDVTENAIINNDLAIGNGLAVGPGGALIEGELSVMGEYSSYIQGALSIGAVAFTPDFGEPQEVYPTHQLDVNGEARFRVNDHNNLLLSSPNAGGDEDAYIDFISNSQTTVVTPTARIAFDAADPVTSTTGITFFTQGPEDAVMVSRLQITPEGDLLPGEDNLYNFGDPDNRWKNIYAVNGVIQTSDRRLKDNISVIPYGITEINALEAVVFNWKDSASDDAHLGFIAQDVALVLPEVVQTGDDPDGMLSMNYAEMIPVLVRAIQEQNTLIETQSAQITELEARLTALEAGNQNNPMRVWIGLVGMLAGCIFFLRHRD